MIFPPFFIRNINKITRHVGLLVLENKPKNNESILLTNLVLSHHIDLILDVGANAGQSAIKFLKLGYTGRILSFEPILSAFNNLKKRSEKYGNWTPFQTAIGAENGEIEINVAGNIESSSVLEMLDKHKKAAPESQNTTIQKTKIQTLNSFFPNYIDQKNNIFLKIDVQGYEPMVLMGADQILPFVKIIQIELSLVPLFKGSPLYKEIILMLEQNGFKLFSLLPGFSDPISGQLYQMDGIFIRE